MSTDIERLSAALADRYRIERELGMGGMATVYLAADLKHDRKVALKVLKPELAAVLGAERFVVEIKTTAALQHPHILPLFDSGTADGFLYYVMPYVEGETLRDKLNRETQFSVDESVRIARDVLDALDYAHRHGVIHRDIKPENILLHDGRPMVADFGIALALSAAAGGRMTETGLSLGTPHYMSPEQATAEKEITGRADQYSLASVLYEMLTGNPPHTGASAQQIIMKIIAEPVEAVTKFRKSVPANVAAAVSTALEKLPADRFTSAKAFADALVDPTFATAGMAQAGSGAGMTGSRGVSPRRFQVTAAVAALALIAAAWGWLRPAPPADVSRLNVLLPDSANLAEGGVFGYRLAVSPDGRTLVYVGKSSTLGRTQLFLRRLDQLTVVPLAGTEGATNPSFSPDGERVAFVSGAPRALKVISASGGPPIALTDSLVDAGGVSWSSDGYIYYDGKLTGDGLARIRASGGRPEIASMPDTAAGERWHAAPAALFNGRGVLFAVGRARSGGNFDIAVLDTKSGKHRVLVRGVFAKYAESGHLLYVTSDGTLMAVRFDADRLTTSGEAVAITQGLAVRGLSRVDLDISARGLVAYSGGAARTQSRELVWLTRDGAASVVDTSWRRNFVGRASLSPDGRSAAVSVLEGNVAQVWVKQLDRGPASKLADNGTSPSWSPDGRAVVYSNGSLELLQGPADGSVLPVRRFGALASPQYSRDGQWIIGAYGGDIFAVATTGDSTRRLLVGGPDTERRGTLSPDGRWLAYESDEGGRTQLYVRPFPDTKSAKRQVSVAGAAAIRWSRDGRELFFLDEQNDMIAVPVTLSPTFAAGIPRKLFSYAPFGTSINPFDVSPDGRRFLTARNVGRGEAEGADRLVVVQNFFEELKAKVKR